MKRRGPGVIARLFPLSIALAIIFLTTPQIVDAASGLRLSWPEQGAISALSGERMPAYHVSADGAGFDNRALGLSGSATPAGVSIQVDGRLVGLRGVAYGYGDALSELAPVAPTSVANRIEYRREGITEWYVNGPLGIEQGFTLERRPTAPAAGPLTLVLATRGATAARVASDGRSLELTAADGRSLLGVNGLFAYDAAGRELPARFEADGALIRMRVDDNDAVYPVVVDPFVQRAELKHDFRSQSDLMGWSIDVAGDVVAVGAKNRAILSILHEGAIFVYRDDLSGFRNASQTAALAVQNAEPGSVLGNSVAVDENGDVVAGGAPGAVEGAKTGAIYVYERPVGDWGSVDELLGVYEEQFEDAALTASDGDSVGGLGGTIDADGGVIIGLAGGTIYVFEKPGANWADMTETAQLSPGGATLTAVRISGDTIVARSSDDGTILIYVRAGANWINAAGPDAVLTVPGTESLLGMSIQGDTVVASRFEEAAYVFVKPGGGWVNTSTPDATLTASDDDQFGRNGAYGVLNAQSDDTIAVAAREAGVQSVKGDSTALGKVYVYRKPTGGWGDADEDQQLFTTELATATRLGHSLAMDGTRIAAGAATYTEGGGRTNIGRAYVFNEEESCPATPASGCLLAAKGKLGIKTKVGDQSKNKIRFQWKKSVDDIGTTELGTPEVDGGTAFLACIYDSVALTPELVSESVVGPKSIAPDRVSSTWVNKRGTRAFASKKSGNPDGILKAKVKYAVAGKGAFDIAAAGYFARVPEPFSGAQMLAAEGDVIVQIHPDRRDTCLESTFNTGIKKNTPTKVVAK